MRALRTVEVVLYAVGGMLYGCAQAVRWPLEGSMDLSIWDENVGAVAIAVPDRSDWGAISAAFHSARNVVRFQGLAADNPPEDWHIELFRQAVRDVEKALDVIRAREGFEPQPPVSFDP
jgi:hypothetical protein